MAGDAEGVVLVANKRRCLFCKEYFNVGDGLSLPVGFFCSFSHATEYAKKKQDKLRAKEKKKVDAVTKEERKQRREADRRKLSWQHAQTQPVFNKMRRLEEFLWFQEHGLPPTCISCGKELGGDVWACGHFKTRAAQPGLRYDRKNTYLEHNVRCNKNLSGDVEGSNKTRGYKNGLRERFGEAEGNAIIEYCETNTQTVVWTWQEIEAMRKTFSKIIRDISILLQ